MTALPNLNAVQEFKTGRISSRSASEVILTFKVVNNPDLKGMLARWQARLC